MKSRKSRRRPRQLVVDTSVARSAGGENAVHPTSRNCRAFLRTMLEGEHRLVMTPDIISEWKRHRSMYAQRWLVQMYSRRRVDHIPLPDNSELHKKIFSDSADREDDRCYEAIQKDLILLDPALATDKIVVSLDERVRACFALAARSTGELRSLVWVCPGNDAEEAVEWLRAGARPERQRQLAHISA